MFTAASTFFTQGFALCGASNSPDTGFALEFIGCGAGTEVDGAPRETSAVAWAAGTVGGRIGPGKRAAAVGGAGGAARFPFSGSVDASSGSGFGPKTGASFREEDSRMEVFGIFRYGFGDFNDRFGSTLTALFREGDLSEGLVLSAARLPSDEGSLPPAAADGDSGDGPAFEAPSFPL